MKAVLQRVSEARVLVDGRETAGIGSGVLVLLGVGHGDGEAEARYLAKKASNLRIFEDDAGKTNLSLVDVGGEALVVSQFTLLADTRRGRRPSFTGAAPPALAEPLVEVFAAAMASLGISVAKGQFGAFMQVELVNSGPMTILLEH